MFNTATGQRAEVKSRATDCAHESQGVDVAQQYFKPIPEEVIEALIAKGDVMYCCGGFMIDDVLIEPYLAERVGDEDSILGLPMKLLRELMDNVGEH